MRKGSNLWNVIGAYVIGIIIGFFVAVWSKDDIEELKERKKHKAD